MRDRGDMLVCPLQWEPGSPARSIAVADAEGASFDDASLRLARGIGDLTALALGNARRISEFERFHRLVESLDAVFWEAEADTLRVTFLAGRVDALFGAGTAAGSTSRGGPTSPMPTARSPSPRFAARSPTAPTRAWSTGSAAKATCCGSAIS